MELVRIDNCRSLLRQLSIFATETCLIYENTFYVFCFSFNVWQLLIIKQIASFEASLQVRYMHIHSAFDLDKYG